MHPFGKIGRAALAVGGALALTTGLATSAQAATGTFSYVRADTHGVVRFDNPSDGFCFALSGQALSVTNNTNSTALLFADAGCDPNAFIDAAQPGQTRDSGANLPTSVRFGG